MEANTTQLAAKCRWLNRNPEALSHVHQDMHMMHAFYGFHDKVRALPKEHLQKLLDFRFNFLQEELDEGRKAISEKSPEEVVDSIIDLIVVAVGTLDLFDIDFDKAWFSVLKANMSKEVGVKASRPNPLGLPDLIKPMGWTAPSHQDNLGLIPKAISSQD